MNTQLQFNDRLYHASLSYRPTDTGGLLVLTTEFYPPYPPPGDYGVGIYLDGYRVNSSMVDWGDYADQSHVTMEQFIALEFNRVPDSE